MKYEKIMGYKEEQFRRIAGAKRGTFEAMAKILREAYGKKHMRRGRKSKMCIEDMLPAALEYLREYRTYAHIAASYGVAESNLYRTVKWVEDAPIKDGVFSLPGKKALLKSETAYEAVPIDAAETPIERPKKGGVSGIRQTRKQRNFKRTRFE